MSSTQNTSSDDAHNPMTSVNHSGKRSGSGQLFSGITDAKRHPSNDKAEGHRQSLTDQSAPKGMLGKAFDSLVKPKQEK